MEFLQQLTFNLAPGPEYEPEEETPLKGSPAVRLIAYYLPQFHPIPENDAWWGKGFTEWRNVTRGIPRFQGHYQPRLPGELGFYDLRIADVLRRQAELAKKYGIYGFCFHYYWFGGKRLLSTPLELLIKNKDIDLPFCINWANENWTRKWDGGEADVLIAQNHSAEDDAAFARSLERLFADPWYIRIDNRPLVMIYRPAILPDAKTTVDRWRKYFRDKQLGEIYCVMAQTFGDGDPQRYGMDAAAGFPPHNADPKEVQSLLRYDSHYKGSARDYMTLMANSLAKKPSEYTFFPGVCPSWDNEARRPGKGISFVGSEPRRYAAWLAEACNRAITANHVDERIVFINAWNEWAEGAYLEPDRHYGYAYLAETARALGRIGTEQGDMKFNEPVRAAVPNTLFWFARRVARKVLYTAASGADALARLLRRPFRVYVD
jgi:lipopolysaccharide biosynthesis protein